MQPNLVDRADIEGKEEALLTGDGKDEYIFTPNENSVG